MVYRFRDAGSGAASWDSVVLNLVAKTPAEFRGSEEEAKPPPEPAPAFILEPDPRNADILDPEAIYPKP